MGVRASFYSSLAKLLCEKGQHVITADYRGQGNFSLRPSYSVNFSYETLVQDVGDLVQFAQGEFPQSNIYLLGHSLGGQIGSLYTSRYPDSIKGILLCAACSVYYQGWDGRQAQGLRFISHVMYPLSRAVGFFPGNTVGFGGKEARGVIRDWCRTVRSGRYDLVESDFAYEEALAKTQLSIFAASMEQDWLAPPQSVKNLYEKFHPDSDLKYIHVTPEESGIANLDHFTWAKYPEYISERIVEWLHSIK